MATLPSYLRLDVDGISIGVTHGSPFHTSEFIFASTPWEKKQEYLRGADVSIMFAGHSGVPFISAADGQAWINSGALGMPANDGTQRVWYAMVTISEGREVTVELLPLEYSWRTAQAAMVAAHLPNEYARALETGLWPSLDVLPLEERGQAGVPLNKVMEKVLVEKMAR
jgi:hypothetical protein